MLTRRVVALLLAATVGSAAACTGSDRVGQPPPISVPDADPSLSQGGSNPALRIGTIVNSAAPSLELDRAIVEVFDHTIGSVDSERAVLLEAVTISDAANAASAVSALTELGVTVLITTCDSASIPALLEATAAVGMLAVTGCPTVPSALVDDVPGPLTIHFASFDDNAAAMARWAEQRGYETAATLRSTLVGDVDSTCAAFEQRLTETGAEVAASIEFAGLLDDPGDSIADQAQALSNVDVLAICALPGAVSDVVSALRSANLDQPIVTPWFAESENWDDEISDVFVVAAASRHGDDPSAALNTLFDSSEPELVSTAAVAAEVVELLISVSESTDSVGSRSLDDAILATSHELYTGVQTFDDQSRRAVGRQYRVLEVARGRASFSDTVSAES